MTTPWDEFSEPIFSKVCLRGHTRYALEGKHNENGGFGEIWSRSFRRRAARRLVSPACRESQLQHSPRGGGVCAIVRAILRYTWYLFHYPYRFCVTPYQVSYLPTYLSIYLSILLTICPSINLSINLSIHLFIHLSIDRSIYTSIHLSIDPYDILYIHRLVALRTHATCVLVWPML